MKPLLVLALSLFSCSAIAQLEEIVVTGTRNSYSDYSYSMPAVSLVRQADFLVQNILSIVGPEQYRYEIIQRIADESRKLQQTLAGECRVSIRGLEGRVEWKRTGVSELTLYIPYETEIAGCQFQD